jgi:small subunit ribosomal protein S3
VGQKIHPIGFRLGIVHDHRSNWFADTSRYPELLQEDQKIRAYVQANLKNAGIAQVKVDRKADQVDLEVHTSRPGVVVGRGGAGIESLREGIQKLLGGTRQIRINVIEVARVDADAALIAENWNAGFHSVEWCAKPFNARNGLVCKASKFKSVAV